MWYIGRLKNSEWYWIFLFAIFMLITGVNIFLMCIPLRSHKIAEGCIYIIFVAIQESLPIILYKKAYDKSYKVSGGKLITHKREGRKTVRIDEIKTIVVTGNFSGRTAETMRNSQGVRCNCPLIEMYLEDLKASLDGITFEHPMINGSLQKAGIVKDNQWCYRIVYNPKILGDFLKLYGGNVFVARTVYMNFKHEIDDIYNRWQCEDKTIKILHDCNTEGSPCNSPFL